MNQKKQVELVKYNVFSILNMHDIIISKNAAVEKIRIKENLGISNRNMGFNGSIFEKEFLSICAEISFLRMLGFEKYDVCDFVNNNFYDFEFNSIKIDVKSTNHKNPRIFIPYKKAHSACADVFVLIRKVRENIYQFCGSCNKNDLVSANNFNCPSGFYENVYNMENKDLKNFSIFI